MIQTKSVLHIIHNYTTSLSFSSGTQLFSEERLFILFGNNVPLKYAAQLRVTLVTFSMNSKCHCNQF